MTEAPQDVRSSTQPPHRRDAGFAPSSVPSSTPMVDLRLGPPSAESEPKTGLGIVVPFDFAVDHDYWAYVFNAGRATLHLTRTEPGSGPISLALAKHVGDLGQIRDAAQRLVAVCTHIVYACTSGSFVNGRSGEQAIVNEILAAGAATAMTTSGAALEAMSALGVERVAILTPYDRPMTAALESFLMEAGIRPVAASAMGLTEDIHLVPPDEIRAMVREADDSDADAVFVSCTGLETYGLIRALEDELGKPVLTANQVTMWAALRTAGLLKGDEAPHRLFAAGAQWSSQGRS